MHIHAFLLNTLAEFIICRALPTSVHSVWIVRLSAAETSIRRGGKKHVILRSDFIIGQLLGSRTAKCHT